MVRMPSAQAGQIGNAMPEVAAAIQVANAPLPEMPATTPHAVDLAATRCASGIS